MHLGEINSTSHLCLWFVVLSSINCSLNLAWFDVAFLSNFGNIAPISWYVHSTSRFSVAVCPRISLWPSFASTSEWIRSSPLLITVSGYGRLSIDRSQMAVRSSCTHWQTSWASHALPMRFVLWSLISEVWTLISQMVAGKPIVIMTIPGSEPSLPSLMLYSHTDVVPTFRVR